MGTRERVVEVVEEVRALPYVWPAPPDADAARRDGRGSCASKHALLAEELDAIDVASVPMFVLGRLVSQPLSSHPDLREGADLSEVHECLTVLTPWAGPLRVDVTWDPVLLDHGLPGTRPWDGVSDMEVAVEPLGPGWAVAREGLREAKEALRSRLYEGDDREVRDRVLAILVQRFEIWRGEPDGRR